VADQSQERIQELLEAAERLEPAARSAYLDQQCGDDSELRAAVESLLAAGDRAGERIRLPSAESAGAADSTATTASSPARGQVIDRYHLLEKLGEGGMGEVWLAEQRQPVHRRVALKLIKVGMDTAHVVARFEAERQALALMDHPAIAKVFDAGATPAGRPYFVMEYVGGLSITSHCDRQRLGVTERLELFVEVCEGIQHAHQKAVLHRDLKPSNVLVASPDGSSTPKIIDFGVAKAMAQPLTERTLHTALGMPIGTLGYMSPEQSELGGIDVDTRTDVYSLGVLLYELLVGVQPFERQRLLEAGWAGVGKLLREQAPPTPSRRLSTLPPDASVSTSQLRRIDPPALKNQLLGDLDWIVMKAIEPDRNRRYGSPAELAEDIRRHLRDEPVLAASQGATYRMAKFVRRHRLGVAAASLVALAVVAGLIGTTTGLVRARRAEAEARKQAQTSERVSEFISGMFTGVDHARMGNAIFDGLKQELEEAERARGADESQVAAKLATFDAALGGLNRYDFARRIIDEQLLSVASAALEERMASEPLVVARLQSTLGRTYANLTLWTASEAFRRKALETRRRVLGPEHHDTIESMIDLSNTLANQGRREESIALLNEALEIQRRVLGPEHPDTLSTMRRLCGTAAARDEEGLKLCRAMVESYRRALGDDHPETAGALRILADILSRQGLKEEAAQAYLQAHESHRRGSRMETSEALTSMNNLAGMYCGQSRVEEAERLYKEVIEVRRRVFGPDNSMTLAAQNNLAHCYLGQGRAQEAVQLLELVVAARRRLLGESHLWRLDSIRALARAYVAVQRYEDAKKLYLELIDQRRRIAGDEDPETLTLIDRLVSICAETDASQAFAPLLPILKRAAEKVNADPSRKNSYAWALLNLEPAQLRDRQAALRMALEAVEATERKNWAILDTLALAYYANGRYEEAARTQTEAIALIPTGQSRERDEARASLARYEASRATR
jgi:tetratricopeptide (TPR) repeat protein